MIAKVYLASIDDEEVNEVFTYVKILRVAEVELEHKKNQWTKTKKVYYSIPLYERPSRIDKYLSKENVKFLHEPKIFRR